LGRSLDLTGWGVVALALVGNVCVRITWWITRYYRDILQVVSTGGSFSFTLTGTNSEDTFGVLSAIVLAPVIEELLFRGTLFRSCRVRFGPGKAVLLSSVTFGVLHSENVAVFISALSYALAYTRTRSLWAPMILHSVNNGLWFVVTKRVLWEFPGLRLDRPWLFGFFALVLLVGVGVWVQFVRKSWRTLGDPLPPESLQAAGDSPVSLPVPLRAGG
jgi:membrane protease YdiL (CAAX protease family)